MALMLAVQQGDWHCPSCQDMNFARNMTCRRCGLAKPSDLSASGISASAHSVIAARAGAPGAAASASGLLGTGDWICPGCKDHQFASRTACRQCHYPKPEAAHTTIAQQLGTAVVQAAAAASAGAVGFLPAHATPVVSPWAQQWNSGPANGMLVGESELPDWMRKPSPFAPEGPGNDDSEPKLTKNKILDNTSSGASAGKDSEATRKEMRKKEKKKKKKDKKQKKAKTKESAADEDGDAASGGADAPDARPSARPSASPTGSPRAAAGGADGGQNRKPNKKQKKTLDVEEELELRRQQRERRQNRVIALD